MPNGLGPKPRLSLETIEHNIAMMKEALYKMLKLIQDFDEAKKAEGSLISSISKSAIVVQRTTELQNHYKNVLFKLKEFKKTSNNMGLLKEIQEIAMAAFILYNANKEIMYLNVQLQKSWNNLGVMLVTPGIAPTYRALIDILSTLEAEEKKRTGKISKSFEDQCKKSDTLLRELYATTDQLKSLSDIVFSGIAGSEAASATQEQQGDNSRSAIKADGNCMYNAVIAALEDITGGARVATTLLGGNAEERMRYLRRVVAERVRAMYDNGVDENNAVVLNNAIATARRHPDFEGDEEEAVDFYIETIITTPGPHNWGDHTVLQIIAEALRIVINVYQGEGGAVITITPTQGALDTDFPVIRLSHQGEVHYEVHRENGYDNMPALEQENNNHAIVSAIVPSNGTAVPDEDDLAFMIGESFLLPPSSIQ